MNGDWTESSYVVGIDLGQASDYSAVSVLEPQIYVSGLLRERYPFPAVKVGWNSPASLPQEVLDAAYGNARGVPRYVNELNYPWPGKPHLALRHIERFRGMPYPQVVERVQEIVRQDPISRLGAVVVVDGTGVGRAVVDMFRQTDLNVWAVSIHGGDSVNRAGGYLRVPKRDLVAAVQSTLQTGRLHVAEGLDLWSVLRTELQNFKVKIDPKTAHDSYSAWRENEHDDLVIATAMPIWWRDFYWRGYDESRIDRRHEYAA